MYGKLMISADMTVLTGLHIGGGNAFSAIGAVDSPVVRDAYSGQPMIPGSSIKGKMRFLLAKATSDSYLPPSLDRESEELTRLFGTAGNNREGRNPQSARLQFADCFLKPGQDVLRERGFTETKFENTIDRKSSVANPRQIERVVRNSVFVVRMVYDMSDEYQIADDFAVIARGLKLLSMDYLGGHGSRGYGRVGFSDVDVVHLTGKCPVDISELKEILKDVEGYAVFRV